MYLLVVGSYHGWALPYAFKNRSSGRIWWKNLMEESVFLRACHLFKSIRKYTNIDSPTGDLPLFYLYYW